MTVHTSTTSWDEPTSKAIARMQRLISRSYPGTCYTTSYQDDPPGVHMVAIVDTEDLDAVVDCYIDQLLTLQVDKGIPLYVIPVRSAERIAREPLPPLSALSL